MLHLFANQVRNSICNIFRTFDDQLVVNLQNQARIISFFFQKACERTGAAGKIHSDFERGFIRAEIVAYDALMEAGGTYEELIGEFGPEPEDDPICDYDFLGRTAYGFECPTENNLACNFICADIGTQEQLETGTGCKLLTVLTTAATYEQIDELLDLIEENISFN